MTKHKVIVFIGVCLMIGLALILGGCSTVAPVPNPQVIVTPPITKFVVVTPTNDLIKDCEITSTPPDVALYVAASSRGKEQYLFDYASSLQADTAKCNLRWKTLRDYLAAQSKLYDNSPDTTKQ